MINLNIQKDQNKALESVEFIEKINYQQEVILFDSKMQGFPRTNLVENVENLSPLIERAPGTIAFIPLFDGAEWVGAYLIPRDLMGCYFIPFNLEPHWGGEANNVDFKELSKLGSLESISITSFNNKIVQKKLYQELGFMTPNFCDFKLMGKYFDETKEYKHIFDVYALMEEDSSNFFDNKSYYDNVYSTINFPIKHATIRSLLFYGDFLNNIVRVLFEKKMKYFNELSNDAKMFGMDRAASFFLNTEMELINIIVKMELEGLTIDFNEFEKAKQELVEEKSRLNLKLESLLSGVDLSKLTGFMQLGNVNVDVTDDKILKNLIYKCLGLVNVEYGRQKERVNANTLQALGNQYPQYKELLDTIIEIRKIDSVYNQLANQDLTSKKIYATFDQFGTATGRIISKEPNIQGLSKKLRRIVKAEEGKVLIGCDFHQEEPRIVASLTQNKRLRAIFEEDDIYIELYRKVFQTDDIDDLNRQILKTIFLAIIYGATDIGIAKQLNVTVNRVQEVKGALLNVFPELERIKEQYIEFAKNNGYIMTVSGRKRRFPVFRAPDFVFTRDGINIPEREQNVILSDLNGLNEWRIRSYLSDLKKRYGIDAVDNRNEKKSAERQTLNAYAQGSAADILKEVVVRMSRDDLMSGLGVSFRVFSHDEIVIEANESTKEEARKLLEDTMVSVFEEWFNFPISVSSYISKNWE